MPYRHKRSKYWTASYTDANGRRVQRSTGTSVLKEAKALEARWRSEAWDKRLFDEEPPHTFEELMLMYLKSTGSVKRSAKTDRVRAKSLNTYFAGKVVNHLKPQHIHEFIDMRRSNGVSDKTINKEMSLLSTAIKYAKRERGWDIPNPVEGRRLSESEGRLRWLTREEAESLIEAARIPSRNGHPSNHLADFILLALHTGCRSSELLGLEWNRVDLHNNLILLEAEHTKSGKRRSVPINADARVALLNRARYRSENCPDSPWVFVHSNPRLKGGRVLSVKRGFATACKRAGIVDCTPHTLRHTCASWLVMEGRSLMEIRDILGHSTIKMTERYAHLAPEQLREAVSVLESRRTFAVPSRPTHRLLKG